MMHSETMRDRFATVANALVEEDERSALVLADISWGSFVDAAARHPDRVVNVGIREQLMISVAGGLALAGMRPIAHSYTPFLVERPFEQVKLDLGHQGVGAILVSIGGSYDGPGAGRTHQAPEDVALLATLPGWQIHVPGHPAEVESLLRHAAGRSDNVYLRLSATSNRDPHSIQPGRFTVARQGRRGTVIAVGPMYDRVDAATHDLDVTLLYAATVRPFDASTLRETLGDPAVVLVEPYQRGTSAGAVSEALRDVPHRLLALGVGLEEVHRYGTPEEHDRLHGLDVAGIRSAIEEFLI